MGNDITRGFLTTYGINECADSCDSQPSCGGFGFSTNSSVYQNYCFLKSAIIPGGSAITGFFCYAKLLSSSASSSNSAMVVGIAVGSTVGGVVVVSTVVVTVLYYRGPEQTRLKLKKAFQRKHKASGDVKVNTNHK